MSAAVRTRKNVGRARLGRRGLGCLGLLVGLLLSFYAVQAALRSPLPATVEVLAHRGGPVMGPESTLATYQRAIDAGVQWLEMDVQMSKDGVLVVIHDETVDRTTNGTGAVADLTYDELRALDAGEGQPVPSFDEVLALAKANGVNVFPETKSAHLYPGVEAKLLQTLEEADYLDHTIVQSFEADSLTTLRQLNPDVQLCALSGLWKLSVAAPPAEAQYVCPMAEMVILNPYMIRQAHNEGRKVIVWFGPVENGFVYRFLRFFGADGIISNDPVAVREAVGR
jgi:glycerophosphoryl diester phosphodiesterase